MGWAAELQPPPLSTPWHQILVTSGFKDALLLAQRIREPKPAVGLSKALLGSVRQHRMGSLRSRRRTWWGCRSSQPRMVYSWLGVRWGCSSRPNKGFSNTDSQNSFSQRSGCLIRSVEHKECTYFFLIFWCLISEKHFATLQTCPCFQWLHLEASSHTWGELWSASQDDSIFCKYNRISWDYVWMLRPLG